MCACVVTGRRVRVCSEGLGGCVCVVKGWVGACVCVCGDGWEGACVCVCVVKG